MKALAGTRAGKRYAISFDAELMMQHGLKLFLTRSAVMTSDWVSNEFIIAVFDCVRHEFIWFNRAYGRFRESYQKAVQKSIDEGDTTMCLPPQDGIDGNAHTLVNANWFVHDRLREGKMAVLKQKERLPGIIRENATREGVPASEADELDYEKGEMMAPNLTSLCGHVRQKRWVPKHQAPRVIDFRPGESMLAAELLVAPKAKCPHRLCGRSQCDGYLRCRDCGREKEVFTAARIATEIVKSRRICDVMGLPFSMDKIQERASHRERVERKGSRGPRTTFQVLKTQGKNACRKLEKLGLYFLTERLAQDPYYQWNCAQGDLSPEALDFLQRIAKAQVPHFERTRDEILDQKVDVHTRLCIVPRVTIGPRSLPIEINEEVFVYDFGRFYRLDEFATASTVIRRARGRDAAVLYGWGNDKLPINPKGDPKAVLQDLINFAKDNIKIWESAAGTSQVMKIL